MSLQRKLTARLRGTAAGTLAWQLRDAGEGLVSLIRAPLLRRRRRGAAIVMYHGVAPEIRDPLVEVAHIPAALFRRQVRHLKRHYRVVALAELVEQLLARRPIPDDWVVLTFDDGYRNNLTCARQILREEGDLPMSLFVVSEFVGSQATLLTTLSVMAIAHTRLSRIRVPRPGGEWGWRPLRSRRERSNCFWEMLPVFKALPAPEQQAVAAEFFAQLADGELAEIRSRFPSCEWLDWDEVRELHADGVDIGGHTRTHVSLRDELGPQRLRQEVFGCFERLEKELGVPPPHFAYPNGQAHDYGPLAVETVRQAGFRAALTTVRGPVRADASLFELTRLGGCIGSLPRFRIATAAANS